VKPGISREEYQFGVFYNRVLMKLFGHETEEMTGGWSGRMSYIVWKWSSKDKG
jgi:hypothetical protein